MFGVEETKSTINVCISPPTDGPTAWENASDGKSAAVYLFHRHELDSLLKISLILYVVMMSRQRLFSPLWQELLRVQQRGESRIAAMPIFFLQLQHARDVFSFYGSIFRGTAIVPAKYVVIGKVVVY